jgi:hypothetical protein
MSEAKEQQASEMVERVARALYELGATTPGDLWGCATPTWQESARREARAAIAAMGDPTEAMCAAGASASTSVRPEGVPLIWRAMIDEALK